MKIAIAGAHQTGKTTLLGELSAALRAFRVVEEPYYLLEEEGHAFSDPPTPEDFALQLERSVQSILENDGDCLFDRCPYDLLAYLSVLDDTSTPGPDGFPGVEDAIEQLSLIVFVPIEDPDRVSGADTDLPLLRRRVDEELRTMVLDDPWASGVPAIEVAGSPEERARMVLDYLSEHAV